MKWPEEVIWSSGLVEETHGKPEVSKPSPIEHRNLVFDSKVMILGLISQHFD